VGALGVGELGFEGGVVLLAVEFVLLEVEELAEEGLGTGEEAAVVVPEAGQGGGLVLQEVEGREAVVGVLGAERGTVGGAHPTGVVGVVGTGGVVGVVVVGAVGTGGVVGVVGVVVVVVVEGGGEDLVFEGGDLVELPGEVGELGDEDLLHGGRGAEFFDELLLGLAVGGVRAEVGGRGGGGEVVGAGVLGGAGFAFRGAGAGGVLGVAAVAFRSRGVRGPLSLVRCFGARGQRTRRVVGREGDAGHVSPC
jgi:hypothetical protein